MGTSRRQPTVREEAHCAMLREIIKLNKRWFEANKHLTNQQMLDSGVIHEDDLVWINKLRKKDDEKKI